MNEIEADLGLRLLGLGILAFTRIVFVTIQAPILASRHYKGQLKVGFAAALTLVAFPTLPMPEYFPHDFLGFIQVLLTQVIVGLAIGLVSFLVMAGAQFGGEMMDIQMGLSVAASMDPSSGGASKLLIVSVLHGDAAVPGGRRPSPPFDRSFRELSDHSVDPVFALPEN